MKNLLIIVLLIAVAILSYLHFFKTPEAIPSKNENISSIELGKDSLKISIYVASNNDSSSTQIQQNIDKTELAATYTMPTNTNTFATAYIVKPPCCVPPPIIPAEKFSVFSKIRNISIERISAPKR